MHPHLQGLLRHKLCPLAPLPLCNRHPHFATNAHTLQHTPTHTLLCNMQPHFATNAHTLQHMPTHTLLSNRHTCTHVPTPVATFLDFASQAHIRPTHQLANATHVRTFQVPGTRSWTRSHKEAWPRRCGCLHICSRIFVPCCRYLDQISQGGPTPELQVPSYHIPSRIFISHCRYLDQVSRGGSAPAGAWDQASMESGAGIKAMATATAGGALSRDVEAGGDGSFGKGTRDGKPSAGGYGARAAAAADLDASDAELDTRDVRLTVTSAGGTAAAAGAVAAWARGRSTAGSTLGTEASDGGGLASTVASGVHHSYVETAVEDFKVRDG